MRNMSQKSLYDFETEQIDKMFDCKNYLFKNSKHEKVILESDTGVKMVRHIIYKPADVSVIALKRNHADARTHQRELGTLC